MSFSLYPKMVPYQRKKKFSDLEALRLIQEDLNPEESGDSEGVESNDDDDDVRIAENVCVSSSESEDEEPGEIEPLPNCQSTAKDGMVWSQIPTGTNRGRAALRNVMRDAPGPTRLAKDNISSALTSFLCLLDTQMLDNILKYTEAEAGRSDADGFNLTLDELKAFVGLLYLRGITGGKSMCLEDYWSADLGFPIFRETMSRQRFRSIMKYLRFDDKPTRNARLEKDKFALISEIFGAFVKNCTAYYNPGTDITVDEQLFPTKARCRFTQYMASKPDKFGIKFWVAADVQTKYMLNMFPYLGKDERRPTSQRLPDSVVMQLMTPFLNTAGM